MDGLCFSVDVCVIQLPCNVREKVEGEVGGENWDRGEEERRRGLMFARDRGRALGVGPCQEVCSGSPRVCA